MSDEKPTEIDFPDRGDAGGDDAADVAAATRDATLVDPPTKQPTQRGMSKAQKQDRNADGSFAAKLKAEADEEYEEARRIVRETMQRQSDPDEDDGRSLDTAPKNGKDSKAKTDPASKEDGATAKAKPEKTSPDATRALKDARQALALEGWSEDDLADLTDERIVALGTKAAKLHGDRDRKLREAAEAAKKPDPAKSSATDATATSDDDEAYGALATEHFAQFEDDGDFKKSIASFSRAAHTRHAEAVKAMVDKTKTEMTEDFGKSLTALRGEMRFEHALEGLRGTFSQIDGDTGVADLRARMLSLATEDQAKPEAKRQYKDVRALARAAADNLWKGENDVKAAEKAKADKIRAAKDVGPIAPNGHRPTGKEKPQDDMDVIREVVREKMFAQ